MIRVGDIVDNLSTYHPNADLELINKAYIVASMAHRGQIRKSQEPYFNHPLHVAYLITRLNLDEASVCCGLLHDTVEDTDTTLEDIKNGFGEEIAGLVDGMTKLNQIEYSSKEDQQAENFRKLVVATSKDIRVILIKLADRYHNMSTLGSMPPHKQERIAAETFQIYAPLANRLGIGWIKTELEDISFKYLYPNEYKEIRDNIDKTKEERKKYIQMMEKLLKEKLNQINITSQVFGRAKHITSIYRKMKRSNIDFDQVYDIIAFRILTKTIPECYEVLGLIHGNWKPLNKRFKDYIGIPKPNLYRSLHTTVVGPKGEMVEVQIRTEEMNMVAEEGIAAHWRYKEKNKKLNIKDHEQFSWLRQLGEWVTSLKDPKEFWEIVKVDLFTDEVYAFTPRGEVKALPEGATPIDFAYAIHTEVGDNCVGAKVNGRIVPLRYQISNGDMIEIITAKNSKPNKDWLQFIKSARAKAKIRSYLKKEQRERSLQLGRELLDKDLKKYGTSLNKVLKSGSLELVAQEDKYNNAEELLTALGFGRIATKVVVEQLVPQDKLKKPKKETGKVGQFVQRMMGNQSSGISVGGENDILSQYAKCCNPLPGDDIIGFITRGRGMTIHRCDCSKVLDQDENRRIAIQWDVKDDFTRPITLKVLCDDKPGILADMSMSFSEEKINITQAHCRPADDHKRAVNIFKVEVKGIEQLNQLVRRLKRVKGVVSVERVSS